MKRCLMLLTVLLTDVKMNCFREQFTSQNKMEFELVFCMLSTKIFLNKSFFGIWSHIFSLPLCFCLFLFSIFCVVGHLTFFHIYFNYVNFGQKVQYFIYTRQGVQNYVFIHPDSLWYARIGITNLNRTYIKKIKVPRHPPRNFHFSVLFFQFLFFYN